MSKERLYRLAFDALELPFFDDSVGHLPLDQVQGKVRANRKRLGSDPALDFVAGLQLSLAEAISSVPISNYRQNDDSLYYGDFSLLDSPSAFVEVANKRLSIIKGIISDLKKQHSIEDDPEIKRGIESAALKAKRKLFKSYDEFQEPFKQSFVNDINLKISEYEKKERERERSQRNNTPSYSRDVEIYRPVYGSGIETQRDILRQREDFMQSYSRNPEGYIKYLQENIPQEVFEFFLKQLRARIPQSARKKHSYIVAESGSGKSELIKTLIYGELQDNKKPSRSIILIDPHGDVAEEIARFREFSTPEGRDRLVYIDPTLKRGFSPSINPFRLDKVTDESVAIMTQELKKILSVLLSSSAPTAQMEAILSPCISTLLRKKGSSFKDLQRFMDDNQNADLVELGCNNPNPEHRSLFLSKFQDDSYRATKHGIYTRIQVLLNDPTFQNLVSNKTTVDLKKLTDEKKIIIFKLSLGEVGSESVEAFGRFIVGIMRVIALQRSGVEKHLRTPIDLYIDEFQNFVSGDIEKALTQLRKYGLYLTLAHQFVNQGDIDTSLQKALFSSGVIVVGSNERKTLKAAEAELNIKFEDLQALSIGQFFIKAGSKPAFRIKAPAYLLGNNHSMEKEAFSELVEETIKKYYAKPEKPKAPPTEQSSLIAEIEQNQAVKGILKKTRSNKRPTENLKPKYDL